MTSPAHPDFEALSAYVDGEAPEWAIHVAACAQCRATGEQIRHVAAAVGAPVDSPSAADQERAVSAALDGALGRAAQAQPDELAARRRRRQPWALPAVAAVIIGLLGFSGLILSSSRSPDETTTLAGPGLQSDKADTQAESGVAAAAPSAPVGDLGDVPDAATLRARTPFAAQSQLAQTSDAPPPTSSATNSGNPGPVTTARASGGTSAATGGAGGAGATATIQTPTTTLNQRSAAAPGVVGTRPCEDQARGRDASLGPVVYFATARQGQLQAYVLGFAPAAGRAGPAVTLLMLAQDGCAELLRTTAP